MSSENKTAKFATPIDIAGQSFTHFEMREASIQDMLDAEVELAQTGKGTHTPLAFNAEMMVLQLVSVSNEKNESFTGPFTMNMLKKWGPRNYRALRSKQVELDLLGEDL